jgi:hypothetical protein
MEQDTISEMSSDEISQVDIGRSSKSKSKISTSIRGSQSTREKTIPDETQIMDIIPLADESPVSKDDEIIDDTPVPLTMDDLDQVDVDYIAQVYKSIRVPDISFKELRHRLSFLLAEHVTSHPDWYDEPEGILMNTPKYIQYQLTCFAILYHNLEESQQDPTVVENLIRFRKDQMKKINSLRDLGTDQTIWFSPKDSSVVNNNQSLVPIYIAHRPTNKGDIELRFDRQNLEYSNYLERIINFTQTEVGKQKMDGGAQRLTPDQQRSHRNALSIYSSIGFVTSVAQVVFGTGIPSATISIVCMGIALNSAGRLAWDSYNPRNNWLGRSCRQVYRVIEDCMGRRHAVNRRFVMKRSQRLFHSRNRVSRPMTLYHVTDALQAIITSRQMRRGQPGQVGSGIYFAHTLGECINKAHHSGWCFRCTVYTGRQYRLQSRSDLDPYRMTRGQGVTWAWLLDPNAVVPQGAPLKNYVADSIITSNMANPTGGEVTVYSWDQVILSQVCKVGDSGSIGQRHAGNFRQVGPWFSVEALLQRGDILAQLQGGLDPMVAAQLLGIPPCSPVNPAGDCTQNRDGMRVWDRQTGQRNPLYHGRELRGGRKKNLPVK